MIAKGHWKIKEKLQEPLIPMSPMEGAIVNFVLDSPRGVYEVKWVSMTSLVEKSMQFTLAKSLPTVKQYIHCSGKLDVLWHRLLADWDSICWFIPLCGFRDGFDRWGWTICSRIVGTACIESHCIIYVCMAYDMNGCIPILYVCFMVVLSLSMTMMMIMSGYCRCWICVIWLGWWYVLNYLALHDIL